MRKTILTNGILLILSILIFNQESMAQRHLRNALIRTMEKEVDEARDRKIREGLRSMTYDNDREYPAPESRVSATIVMQTQTFKKDGSLDQRMKSKIIFGPKGECMVMNLDESNEMWFLTDYDKKAHYLVDVKNKTATKMPIFNLEKMISRLEKKYEADEQAGTWKRTNEQKTINGRKCSKYLYTSDDGVNAEFWGTKEVSLKLTPSHVFGTNVRQFAESSTNKSKEELPEGMVVRSVYYEKGSDKVAMQMDLLSVEQKHDSRYFDLSAFSVNDVLD